MKSEQEMLDEIQEEYSHKALSALLQKYDIKGRTKLTTKLEMTKVLLPYYNSLMKEEQYLTQNQKREPPIVHFMEEDPMLVDYPVAPSLNNRFVKERNSKQGVYQNYCIINNKPFPCTYEGKLLSDKPDESNPSLFINGISTNEGVLISTLDKNHKQLTFGSDHWKQNQTGYVVLNNGKKLAAVIDKQINEWLRIKYIHNVGEITSNQLLFKQMKPGVWSNHDNSLYFILNGTKRESNLLTS
jgi:hypothetical protein